MSRDGFDGGNAGASARREGERRRIAREQRMRDRFPRIGGAVLALQGEPRHERVWEIGAAGEEAVARGLEKRCPDVLLLHDRRMPRSRANIDHLAVAPSGVYVIDAKRYKGKIEVRKPFFGKPKLVIAGRDKTKLVDGLAKQVEAVRGVLAELAPGVAVHGCFCFVPPEGLLADSGLPLIRTLEIKGFPLFYPRRLAKVLNRSGDLDGERQHALATELGQRFPSA